MNLPVIWLDGDGVIIPREWADNLWEEIVPEMISEKTGIPIDEAKRLADNEYALALLSSSYYDPEYWESVFDVSITDKYMHVDPYPDAVKFLESYEGEVYLVTGNPNKWARVLFKKVIHYFKGVYTSGEANLPKNVPEFYRKTCVDTGVKCKYVVFVDDEPSYISAARQVGIDAVLMDRYNKYPDFDKRIASLDELNEYIQDRH